MAFKLNKQESARKSELLVALQTEQAKLEDALRVYNEEASTAFGRLEAAKIAYNEALEAARSFAEDIASEQRTDYDDHSEKWQEGENGTAAEEWVSSWEDVELDGLELEEPEALELETPQTEVFEGLEEEVGS